MGSWRRAGEYEVLVAVGEREGVAGDGDPHGRSFLTGLKVVDKSSGGVTRPGAAWPKPSIVSRWWLYARMEGA
jgi:hypothetical protein